MTVTVPAAVLFLTWITAAPEGVGCVATRPASAEGRVEDLMRRLENSEAAERLRAVEGLARLDVPRSRRALMRARRDPDRRVSLAAYRALVMLRAPEFRPKVLEALYRGDEQVRLLAIPWVGEVRPPRAAPALAGLLMDTSSSEAIRLAAARALAVLRDETGIPALAATLNAERLPPTVTEAVRVQAAKSLGELGGRFALLELIQAARRHPSAAVRRSAVVALAPYAGLPRYRGRILQAARAVDALTRREFLRAHVRSPRPSATLLRAFADDADLSVRLEAAAGLCRMRKREGIGLLIGVLEGARGSVREEAHRLLVKHTGRPFPPEAARWRAWWKDARDGFSFPASATRPAGKNAPAPPS